MQIIDVVHVGSSRRRDSARENPVFQVHVEEYEEEVYSSIDEVDNTKHGSQSYQYVVFKLEMFCLCTK